MTCGGCLHILEDIKPLMKIDLCDMHPLTPVHQLIPGHGKPCVPLLQEFRRHALPHQVVLWTRWLRDMRALTETEMDCNNCNCRQPRLSAILLYILQRFHIDLLIMPKQTNCWISLGLNARSPNVKKAACFLTQVITSQGGMVEPNPPPKWIQQGRIDHRCCSVS